MDCGRAASRCPGMTFLTNSSVAHLAKFEHGHGVGGFLAVSRVFLGKNQ
jgi:hypothetical protein